MLEGQKDFLARLNLYVLAYKVTENICHCVSFSRVLSVVLWNTSVKEVVSLEIKNYRFFFGHFHKLICMVSHRLKVISPGVSCKMKWYNYCTKCFLSGLKNSKKTTQPILGYIHQLYLCLRLNWKINSNIY